MPNNKTIIQINSENFKNMLLNIFLLIVTTSFAQEYRFGEVSKEELLETSYPLDSTADAAVLYESRKVHFNYIQSEGFQIVTEVFKRIKFYNKNGFDRASEEIFLYKKGSDKEIVNGLKGITYNLENDNIKRAKLKKDGIFKNEFSEYNDQVKFTMPSIKEGTVVEFKYKIVSPFSYSIDKIYLQYDIPIKKMDIQVATPEYYNFKKFTTGYLPIDLRKSSTRGKITFTNKTRSGGGKVKTTFSQSAIDYSIMINTIGSSNIPAFKKEPYSGNPDNYLSAIDFELQFTKFPNSIVKNYSTTWEDVAKTVFKDSRFGNELKKTSYFEEDVDQLISTISDSKKKTNLLFNFVKKKMTWNSKYGVFTRDGVKKAYTEGVGNSAEINLMLISILTYAKIDVKPVLVSSVRKTISLFPTLDGFDYVVARVKVDDEIIYLDATDKYGMPNILPDRVVRGMGRVIAKNGTSQIVNFRPEKPSENRFSMQYELDKEGMVKGKFTVYHLDYLAHSFRSVNAEKDDKSKIKRLEQKYEIGGLEEYIVKGVEKYGKGVQESFRFDLEGQVEIIEDEMFFSPLLFLRDKENIFKIKDRKYPIDFGFGFSNKYMINIKLPEDFEVIEYPKSGVFKLPENMGKFAFRSNVANGIMQLVVDETINFSIIPAEYYAAVKEFYNQLVEKENQQVVLKKI